MTNSDRYQELLRQKQASTRRALISLGVVILLTLFGIFGGPFQFACGRVTGYSDAIVEYLAACPAAAERLGTPASFGLIGLSGGNYQSGPRHGGEGRAWATMRVSGPKGSASVDYVMQKSQGVWFAERLVLHWPDGTMLDVKACVSQWEAERRNESLRASLRADCAQGVANSCLALSSVLESEGKNDEARAARESACRLGLSAACVVAPP